MDTTTSDSIWANVPQCPEHPAGYSFASMQQWEECGPCQAEHTARKAVCDQMQAEVNERVNGLTQTGVQFPQVVAVAIRLETMIDYLYAGPARVVFEGEYMRRMLNEVKDAQKAALGGMVVPQQQLHVVRNHGHHRKPQ